MTVNDAVAVGKEEGVARHKLMRANRVLAAEVERLREALNSKNDALTESMMAIEAWEKKAGEAGAERDALQIVNGAYLKVLKTILDDKDCPTIEDCKFVACFAVALAPQ
jgi:hypothetical protein